MADIATIGIIGAGRMGSTIARLAAGAGYEVTLSNSRGPETLAELVTELGPRVRAASVIEAATAADLAVVAVPLRAYRDIPAEPLRGKTVIDTGNYYPDRDGRIADLDEERTTTSELVQRHLRTSHVVKGLNNIYFEHLAALARPHADPERSALAVAGDVESAKSEVTAFLDRIGYDTLDLGSLAEGWRTQRDTAAYAKIYAGVPDHFRDSPARPLDRDGLALHVARSLRYRDMARRESERRRQG